MRLDIRRIETLKEGTDAVGNRTRVKVVKNKMAPPFKQAEFDILYGVGISREGSLIDFGVEHEIVRKSGAWYTYDGDQLGQGKENARKFLLENPTVAEEIERLRAEPGEGNIAIGGAELAAAVAEADLIDEYRAKVYPVLVGGGVPFFPQAERRVELELLETRSFDSGVVYLRHRVRR